MGGTRSNGAPAVISGCPSLEDREVCEVEPQLSWCATTEETCLQQQGESVGNSWTFCDAATQAPTLPSCTCAARWLNQENYCGRSAKRNRGCPSVEELRECDPGYNGSSWCLTNEAECMEQEDFAGSELMVTLQCCRAACSRACTHAMHISVTFAGGSGWLEAQSAGGPPRDVLAPTCGRAA